MEKEDEGTVPTSSLIHSALGPNVNLMTLGHPPRAFFLFTHAFKFCIFAFTTDPGQQVWIQSQILDYLNVCILQIY